MIHPDLFCGGTMQGAHGCVLGMPPRYTPRQRSEAPAVALQAAYAYDKSTTSYQEGLRPFWTQASRGLRFLLNPKRVSKPLPLKSSAHQNAGPTCLPPIAFVSPLRLVQAFAAYESSASNPPSQCQPMISADPAEGEASVVQYSGAWLARVHEDGCVYALWETEDAATAWNVWLRTTTDLNDEESTPTCRANCVRVWDSGLGCYRRQ